MELLWTELQGHSRHFSEAVWVESRKFIFLVNNFKLIRILDDPFVSCCVLGFSRQRQLVVDTREQTTQVCPIFRNILSPKIKFGKSTKEWPHTSSRKPPRILTSTKLPDVTSCKQSCVKSWGCRVGFSRVAVGFIKTLENLASQGAKNFARRTKNATKARRTSAGIAWCARRAAGLRRGLSDAGSPAQNRATHTHRPTHTHTHIARATCGHTRATGEKNEAVVAQ